MRYVETVEHLLIYSSLVRYVLGHFNDLFRNDIPRFYNIKTILLSWFKQSVDASMEGLCYTLAPILIL